MSRHSFGRLVGTHQVGEGVNALWRTRRRCVCHSFLEDVPQTGVCALRPKGGKRNVASTFIIEQGSPSGEGEQNLYYLPARREAKFQLTQNMIRWRELHVYFCLPFAHHWSQQSRFHSHFQCSPPSQNRSLKRLCHWNMQSFSCKYTHS